MAIICERFFGRGRNRAVLGGGGAVLAMVWCCVCVRNEREAEANTRARRTAARWFTKCARVPLVCAHRHADVCAAHMFTIMCAKTHGYMPDGMRPPLGFFCQLKISASTCSICLVLVVNLRERVF